jgi:FkbM family methyltransferase
MPRSSTLLDRLHQRLGNSRFITRLALLVRNQCRAVVKYRLMTTHEVTGSGEAWLAALIAPQCHTFVDVGANRGEWSRLFLSQAPADRRGVLFEPGRAAAQVLRDLFASSPGVEIIEAALGDHEDAEARFFEEPAAGNTSSLTRGAATAAAVETRVRVTTLDAEIPRLGLSRIDLLKIDAEGNDLAVLRGARRLLAERRVRVIQWEYSDAWALAGASLGAALDLLTAAGYRSYLLKGDGLYHFDYEVWGEFFTYANFVSLPEGDRMIPAEARKLL